MTQLRVIGFVVWCCLLVVPAMAQEMVPAPPPSANEGPLAPPASDIPPPPPVADTAPAPVPEPPAAYLQASASTEATTTTTTDTRQPAPNPSASNQAPADPNARRRFNIWVGLGFGDALGCGNEDPDSPCAVDGAVALTLAADFRFYPNFSVGLELSTWGFAVSDQWRGTLPGEQESAEISMTYFAAFGRWYWFDKGIVDPYLQLGLGIGGITASVTNVAGQTYRYSAGGVVPHLGLGADFHVHRAVRLGPQLLAALLSGNRICETFDDEDEMCRDTMKNADGEQEGSALAWRFMLVGTIMLGAR